MPGPRIPEDTIIRTARAINAIEDARDQANEDLKVTWADLREELKSLGLKGAEVSAEVGHLKAAIAETRKTEADHLKAETKAEGMEGYLSILTSPRARARARDDQPQPETAEQSPGVTSTRSTSFAGTEGDEGQHPIQPETANELPPPSRGIGGEDDLREPAATERGQIAQEGDAPLEVSANASDEGMSGRAAHLSTDTENPTRTPAGVVVTNRNGVTGGESAATNSRSGGALDAHLPPKQEIAGSTPAQITNPASPEPPSALAGEGGGASRHSQAAPLDNSAPRSSSGLERMIGCKNLDACAGSRTKRCFTCERDWNAKAHEVDA